jgi:hypothetical protein
MINLPTLPTIPTKVQPGTDRVILFPEPFVPEPISKTIKLSEREEKEIYNDMKAQKDREMKQKGSLIRAIVMRIPADLDESKFKYQIGDVVAIPEAPYESINVNRTPLILVGTRDIKAILPDLTETEVEEWNKVQERFINEVVYPVNKLDAPGPRIGKGGLEGFQR